MILSALNCIVMIVVIVSLGFILGEIHAKRGNPDRGRKGFISTILLAFWDAYSQILNSVAEGINRLIG